MESVTPLGWWSISGDHLLAALRQAAMSGEADLVYAELYANSVHEMHDEES